MLLPETKEREYRFKLALRMGLPIFALIIALLSNTLITSYESLSPIFYFEAILLLAFSIFFIFYIIYSGFNVKISEEISKTFTREYLYMYLKNELKKHKKYTLILVSVDNLHEINRRFGIKNGDKSIVSVVNWIGQYFESKEIKNFPMGHMKGGDFIIGLPGNKSEYNSMLELMSLKVNDFKVDEIEVNILSSITDTSFSHNLDFMIENLFEIQEENKNRVRSPLEEINPSELESYVINAIKEKLFSITTQEVFENGRAVIKECFVKLKSPSGKIIHQKSYMKVLDRLGLMTDFDFMVLEKTIDLCSKDRDKIYALSISPTSIRNHNCLLKLKELLLQIDVNKKIMFILNEKEYYSQIQRFKNTLNSLRDLGLLIALDKLGSNHTSFLYLRDLDIDVVRFDTFYTKEIKNKKFHSIIDGFNVIAYQKGIKTWIKNIEDEESKEIVCNSNIDYVQGKYLVELKNEYES